MIHANFPRYTDFDPLVPVFCATPGRPACIHRFFDTSAISPSGRYLAVFQMPFENRAPLPGEKGAVCLIDLETGDDRIIAETCGWEPQLGANINWGGSDHELFYNDVDTRTWQPFAWKADPVSGRTERLHGTVYHASPDGRWLISANLSTMRRTQPGYGVALPEDQIRRNVGRVEDDGFYITDTSTGKSNLLASIRDLLDRANPQVNIGNSENQEIYGFHCKFNPQGDRLMLSLRWYPKNRHSFWGRVRNRAKRLATNYQPIRFAWITYGLNDGQVNCAVGPEQWQKGGHHATWFPDGQRISMNLNIDGDGLRFVQVNADGSDLKKICTQVEGSGHPTVHVGGKFLLTDTYPYERTAFGDGTVPLRWINLETEQEQVAVRVNTRQPQHLKVLRVDAHPAWDRSWRYVVFNAYLGGSRRVMIADMKDLID